MAKHRYEVTATTGYAGHQPGEQFEAELTEDQERRAVERGAIKRVTTKKKEEATDE